MAMDMLEHETVQSGSSIATRGSSQIININKGGNSELTKSFLLKRMEIEFTALPQQVTNDAIAGAIGLYTLMFISQDRGGEIDTPAEMLDARLDDRIAHQGIIWRRNFVLQPVLVDDADNVTQIGQVANFKTSKSFRKGFRLDKDEDYAWEIFNPAGASQDQILTHFLTVRYWGVYVQ